MNKSNPTAGSGARRAQSVRQSGGFEAQESDGSGGACCTPRRAEAVSPAKPVEPRPKPGHGGPMGRIPVGSYQIGYGGPEARPSDREGPVRRVDQAAFAIDRYPVTNAQFTLFADQTGYRTTAERVGWSFVFFAQLHPQAQNHVRPPEFGAPQWWLAVEGASWRAPDGRGSDHRARPDHPVTHVSWDDAAAYCRWSGRRLPTEEEWEIAARGGREGALYPWGDELTPGGAHMCNIWQGRFPVENSGDDGYLATSPVGTYPPNGYGLYDLSGNVWEWTASPWSAEAPGARALRGGSYLCHQSYCNRYRVSARTGNAPTETASNIGFRCAADASR